MTPDRDIPIPPSGQLRKWKIGIADLRKLKPGESLPEPCSAEEAYQARSNLSSKAIRAGIKYTTRIVKEGVRIWRLE